MITLSQVSDFLGIPDVVSDSRDAGLIKGVCIDSRAVQPGQIFAAFEGQSCDGHDFLDEAYKAGACAALVSRKVKSACPQLLVEDVQSALVTLAKVFRDLFPIPAVAITGSNGKTSTKEMLVSIVSRRYSVCATSKNQNNLLGLALTILNQKPEDGYMIAELGTNAPGEIRTLAELLKPAYAILTQIAPNHLLGLKDERGVFEEKTSLLDGLREPKCVVVNGDDPWLQTLENDAQKTLVTCGKSKSNHYMFSDVFSTPRRLSWMVNDKHKLEINGRAPLYWACNATLALAIALEWNCSWEDIAQGLQSFCAVPGRFEVSCVGRHVWVNDSYNASPSSFDAALESLDAVSSGLPKIYYVGDMLELGDDAIQWHRYLGQKLARSGPAQMYVCGKYSGLVAQSALEEGLNSDKIHVFDKAENFLDIEYSFPEPCLFFVKASHGVGLHSVFKDLQKKVV